MFTFVFVAFVLYLSIKQKRFKDVLLIPVTILIGFLISSAYIVPIIFEKQLVHMKVFVGEGIDSGFLSDFRNFFILPDMTNKFSSSHLWNALYDTFVFYVLLFCFLIILSFHQIVKIRKINTMKNSNIVNIFFLGTAVCTIFLLFGVSTFIWEIIPFFKYIQFSHRWLNITTFAVVFLSSAVFWVLINSSKTTKEHGILIIILSFVCLISLFLDYKYIRFSHIIHEQELIPVRPPHWYKVDLPASVDIDTINKNDEHQGKVIIRRGRGEVKLKKWKSAERVIEITAYQPLTVRIRTFNFPGWKAYIDSEQLEIKTEEGTGAMIIDVPEGEHRIEIKFMDTPIRYYSKIISLASFIFIAFLVVFHKSKKNELLR